MSAPLNTGSQFHGAALHEYEHNVKGARTMRAGGREFLGSVVLPLSPTLNVTESCGLGEALNIFPLAPDALGGRLELLSQTFEEHKLLGASILFEPNLAATASGSIACYMFADAGVPQNSTGRAEMNHAATQSAFFQTSVFESGEVALVPEDTMISYFDEESGDFRMEVQGMLKVITATDFPGGYQVNGSNESVLGNLYLKYDYEFTSPALDYEVQEQWDGILTVATNAFTPAIGTGVIAFDGTTAAKLNWNVTLDGVGDFGDFSAYLFYGTIQHNLWLENTVMTPDSDAVGGWTPSTGQCLFARFSTTADPVLYGHVMTLYNDLASAGAAVSSSGGGVVSTGQLAWASNTLFTSGKALVLRGRFWRIGE